MAMAFSAVCRGNQQIVKPFPTIGTDLTIDPFNRPTRCEW
jgi:hypothetical protein